MPKVPSLKLNGTTDIPQLGFGTWQIPNGEAASAVAAAIAAGYRLIDTAAFYDNERGVGEGLRRSGIARKDLFVTTKLWNTDQGYETTVRAFDASLQRLGLDQLDLYLIHWPAPDLGKFVETWRAFIKLRDEGRVHAIGVSNFTVAHLKRIVDETGVAPVLNQIELHPRFQQSALRDAHAEMGIATQAWSPLGRGELLDDPLFVELARTYGRTPAQIVLRWHVDNGIIAIPKSITPARIAENIAVDDFVLKSEDVDRIATLDRRDGRTGPDPDSFS